MRDVGVLQVLTESCSTGDYFSTFILNVKELDVIVLDLALTRVSLNQVKVLLTDYRIEVHTVYLAN